MAQEWSSYPGRASFPPKTKELERSRLESVTKLSRKAELRDKLCHLCLFHCSAVDGFMLGRRRLSRPSQPHSPVHIQDGQTSLALPGERKPFWPRPCPNG